MDLVTWANIWFTDESVGKHSYSLQKCRFLSILFSLGARWPDSLRAWPCGFGFIVEQSSIRVRTSTPTP
jgi:hypothetical protein